MNNTKLNKMINLKSFGAKIKLGFLISSEIHPKVYIKFKNRISPIKIRNMKYSPFPISISRTFNPMIFKLKKRVINRIILNRILLNSHHRMT